MDLETFLRFADSHPGMVCLFREGESFASHYSHADTCESLYPHGSRRGNTYSYDKSLLDAVLRALLRNGHRVAVCDKS